ncbi:hypothetical protein J6590_030556 [Homalodisca vitripennis]|nr:hypothetical protein J6590_030556 [Homalodisca vitripennis]
MALFPTPDPTPVYGSTDITVLSLSGIRVESFPGSLRSSSQTTTSLPGFRDFRHPQINRFLLSSTRDSGHRRFTQGRDEKPSKVAAWTFSSRQLALLRLRGFSPADRTTKSLLAKLTRAPVLYGDLGSARKRPISRRLNDTEPCPQVDRNDLQTHEARPRSQLMKLDHEASLRSYTTKEDHEANSRS